MCAGADAGDTQTSRRPARDRPRSSIDGRLDELTGPPAAVAQRLRAEPDPTTSRRRSTRPKSGCFSTTTISTSAGFTATAPASRQMRLPDLRRDFEPPEADDFRDHARPARRSPHRVSVPRVAARLARRCAGVRRRRCVQFQLGRHVAHAHHACRFRLGGRAGDSVALAALCARSDIVGHQPAAQHATRRAVQRRGCRIRDSSRRGA